MNNNKKKTLAFKLYTLKSSLDDDEIDRIRAIITEVLGPDYALEVIDLERSPELAEEAQILAIPTLIREEPTPVKRLIGDFRHRDKLLAAIQN